jgi:hypothetical protein
MIVVIVLRVMEVAAVGMGRAIVVACYCSSITTLQHENAKRKGKKIMIRIHSNTSTELYTRCRKTYLVSNIPT